MWSPESRCICISLWGTSTYRKGEKERSKQARQLHLVTGVKPSLCCCRSQCVLFYFSHLLLCIIFTQQGGGTEDVQQWQPRKILTGALFTNTLGRAMTDLPACRLCSACLLFVYLQGSIPWQWGRAPPQPPSSLCSCLREETPMNPDNGSRQLCLAARQRDVTSFWWILLRHLVLGHQTHHDTVV